MMDPFMQAITSLFAASNPQAGPALDAAGIPPPGMGEVDVGSMMTPGAQPQANGMNMMRLAGMQGVQRPQPITPIMSGGVTGGVKAPDPNAAGLKQGAPAIQALMQALLAGGGQDPLRVPSLGHFIRGGKY